MSPLAQTVVLETLHGVSLSDPMEPVIKHLDQFYRGNARKSILAAVSDLYQQWAKLREEFKR